MDSSELLQQLRIDRSEPVSRGTGAGLRIGAAVALLVAALLAVGAWWFLRPKPVVVDVATAVAPAADAATPLAVLQATGYVTARRQATVSAQITGTLVEVLIEEGDQVEAGQVLARLDDTAYRAQLAQAEAAQRAAQAQLAQFRTQLAQSRRDLDRAQELVGRRLVSRQAVERALTDVETLAAQLETQQRQVEVAAAAVAGAKVQLDYCTVRAPFPGVVIAKAAQVGEIVSPLSAGGGYTRTGVGTLVDMDSLEIEVDVNESYINRVAAGQPVEAVLDAYPDWKIPGHVIAIIPAADRSKATVKVRVGFAAKDPRIVPDMGVRVSFLEERGESAADAPPALPPGVLVPSTSIVARDGRSVVFVVDGERVRERAVKAGQTYGELRLVGDLAPGARVVRAPPPGLVDGARVATGKAGAAKR